MSTARKVLSLGGRITQLGLSRLSSMGARAVLFMALGLKLDATSYGTVAILLTLGAGAAMLLDGGMGLLVLQRTGKDPETARQAIGGLLVLRLTGLPLALVGYLAVSAFILGSGFDWKLATLFGLYSIVYPLIQTIFSFLRGMFLATHEAVTSILTHGAEAAITGVWAVAGDHHLWTLAAGLAACRLLCLGTWLVILFVRYRSSLSPKRAIEVVRLGRRESAMLFSLAVTQFVYGQSDVLLLRMLTTTAEAGRYWACYRLATTLLMPIDIGLQAVWPRLAAANERAHEQRIYDGIHGVGLVWTGAVVGLCLLHPDWVIGTLLNEDFEGIAPLLMLVSVAVALSYIPPYGLGLAMGDGLRELLIASSLSAVANIALNLVLVPSWGAVGAALATLGSYAALKLMFWRAFHERKLSPMPWRILSGLGGAGVAWAAVSQLIGASVWTSIAIWLAVILTMMTLEIRRHAKLIEEIA